LLECLLKAKMPTNIKTSAAKIVKNRLSINSPTYDYK
jgi:hypothetical protein